MPGNIIETLKFTQLFEPASVTATGILFNGSATASGIDTRDFDNAVVTINAGVFSSSATIAFDVYENDSDDDTTATAVTDASFGSITSANDQALHIGSISTKATKRYLWLRSNKTANTDAGLFGAQITLGKADKNPQTNSETFNV